MTDYDFIDVIDGWVNRGFTQEEAIAMTYGSLWVRKYYYNDRLLSWRVGNTEFPQAISAEHAQRLYVYNFGENSITVDTDIVLIEVVDGVNWVRESYQSAPLGVYA